MNYSKTSRLASAFLLALGMAACGGSGGSSTTDDGTDTTVPLDVGGEGTSDPGIDDPGSPDAPADQGPDVVCQCLDNDDCVGAFRGLGACERAVCDPESCACVRVDALDDSACDDGDPCTANDKCQAGVCTPGTNECACAEDADCAQFEDGDLCNGTLICDLTQMPTVCVVDPATVKTCVDDDDDPCRGPVCEPETGECIPDQAVNEGGECDDLDACTEDDVCRDGECVGEAPTVCFDGLVCTDDGCDSDTGCVFTYNTLGCEDGDPCTVGDVCSQGVCVPGSLDPCDDDNDCTADSCVTGEGCHHEPLTGTGCSDGDACTVDDACLDGACIAGPDLDCDDDNVCTNDSCLPESGCYYEGNSEDCDDANACTLNDYCAGGLCRSGTLVVCDDLDPCTIDSCDSGTGECVYQAVVIDDQDACTLDQCDPVTGQITHQTIDCDDDNPCTDDSCDPQVGCMNIDNAEPCSDDDACTVGDVCADGDCIPGVATVCDDDNACTVDTCDTTTGECVFTPVNIDDNDACTLDSCDPLTGIISNVALVCDDGDACNGIETCDSNLGCVPGTPLVCDDDDVCNGVFACDAQTGCVQTATALTCDDGNACNGLETCDPVQGCLGGTPPVCNDNDVCNGIETCDPAVGCVPGTALVCSDGNACNGLETCHPIQGCLPGTPPACNDNDVCNGLETCDPAVGCVPGTPLACDDGDACNGVETCHPAHGCQLGTPVVCLNDNPCQIRTCNSQTGACDAELLSGLACDDEIDCTSNDACVLGYCVGVESCCDDDIDNDDNGVADCLDAGCAAETHCHDTNVWCRLQYPETLEGLQDDPLTAYARVYLAGVTDQGAGNNPRPWLKVQFGYGTDADPTAWTAWTAASPNPSFNGHDWGEPNNDEYWATTPAPKPGQYRHAFRVSGDNGQSWTYCDLNRGPGSDGSQDGFQAADAGTLSVGVTNLFFSEYIEGSSNNKAVEVFNAEDRPVNLKRCIIRGYNNGATTQAYAISLPDIEIAAGQTFVVCHTGWALADTACNLKAGLNFNGDDAVVLECGTVVTDRIGQVGYRPPSGEWGTGVISTMDNTLVRRCGVGIGDRAPLDAFDPALEWDGYATDVITYLGSHVHPCPPAE